MKVVRIAIQDPSDLGTLRGMAETIMKGQSAIPVRFLVSDSVDIARDYPGFEIVEAPEAPKEEKPKGKRRGYPSVKVEITGTLAEKLRAYSGTDAFMISVIDSWKKWGKLSPGQIFWIEKKLGA